MPFRQGPASSRGLALFLCLCAVLLLMLAGQTAHGQNLNGSEPPSLTENLAQAELALTLLASRLAERQKQVTDLQASLQEAAARLTDSTASLADLQAQLAEAQALQAQSQTALAETSSSLAELSTRYDALETSWQAYRTEMNKQILTVRRERNRAKAFAWAFGIGTAGGLVACIIMALK